MAERPAVLSYVSIISESLAKFPSKQAGAGTNEANPYRLRCIIADSHGPSTTMLIRMSASSRAKWDGGNKLRLLLQQFLCHRVDCFSNAILLILDKIWHNKYEGNI